MLQYNIVLYQPYSRRKLISGCQGLCRAFIDSPCGVFFEEWKEMTI